MMAVCVAVAAELRKHQQMVLCIMYGICLHGFPAFVSQQQAEASYKPQITRAPATLYRR